MAAPRRHVPFAAQVSVKHRLPSTEQDVPGALALLGQVVDAPVQVVLTVHVLFATAQT